MKPENCPNCNADSEWIEEEAWGDWICENCDTIIPHQRAEETTSPSGWIVREKDESTKALEANIAKNQVYLDEENTKVDAMSDEEREVYYKELQARVKQYPGNSVWTR